MVGATSTAAWARTRCLKYSAMIQSLLRGRCNPCSLDSAPRAITTTWPGLSTRSASSQLRRSRSVPAGFVADSAAPGPNGLSWARARGTVVSATRHKRKQRSLKGIAVFKMVLLHSVTCLARRSGQVYAGPDAGPGHELPGVAHERRPARFLRQVRKLLAHFAVARPGSALCRSSRDARRPARNGQERDTHLHTNSSGRAGDPTGPAAVDDQGRPGPARDPDHAAPSR